MFCDIDSQFNQFRSLRSPLGALPSDCRPALVVFPLSRILPDMEVTGEDIERLLVATLLGAVIGLDREYRGKAAGFRTLMLVSLGSALFMLVSIKTALLDPFQNSDVTRIASNIATGIGFLGAGIIFKRDGGVQGLTTAATVWAASAIAMTAAIGAYSLAVAATALTWITLFVLHYVENIVEGLTSTITYRLSWRPSEGTAPDINSYLEGRSFTLKAGKTLKTNDVLTAEWTIKASKKTHELLSQRLLDDPTVVELSYL